MPTLLDIHTEMNNTQTIPQQDFVRRKYLDQLYQYTKRPTIIYATCFSVKNASPDATQIGREDVQHFMSALKDVKGDTLDLIIHSGGGSAEATEQVVNYLRAKFNDIRVIIPQNAMSAATMLALSANRIVMGKHSAIGPIDPQLTINGASMPAQAIIDEFNQAQLSINTPGNNPIIWINKLGQYPPGLLVQCANFINLSKVLVIDWLQKYMFASDPQGSQKANSIGNWLSNNQVLLSHGRSIGYLEAQKNGLVIDMLEADQTLQELVLSVFHSTVATFQRTACVKIVENHLGKGAYVIPQSKA